MAQSIPQNADAVLGRVGMEECSLDLIFIIGDRPFLLVMRQGLIFVNSLN